MSQYQVYLNDEQKNYLIKYIRDRGNLLAMWIFFVFIVAFVVIFSVFAYNTGIISAIDIFAEGFTYFIIALFGFMEELIRGYGKTFGYRCDIQCIEKDLYTLDYGDFGYREKDTGKHPYYICDNMGWTYICPRFLDYRNADTGSKFLYIKLENGRGYAIADN